MVNSVLSEQLKVKPLNEGETATYRLISANKVTKRIFDEEGHIALPETPQSFSLPSQDGIYDPGQGRTVIIENVVGWKTETMPDKSQKQVPILAAPEFNRNGEMHLTHEQNDTFCYMERHRFNRDNPFRKKGTKFHYYRVSPQKQLQDEIDRFEVIDEAKFYLRDCDGNEVKQIAASLADGWRAKIDLNASEKEIRLALRKMAENYDGSRAILMAASKSEMKWILQIKEAELYRIIEFVSTPGVREWRHLLRSKLESHVGKNKKPCPLSDVICQIEVGQDPYKGFLGLLQEDKEGIFEHYRFMALELKKMNDKTN